MFKLRNPLPQAIRDTELLSTFYREWNLVPYAGNSLASSHVFLRLLNDLYELSPSHSSCIDDKKKWSFEGELEIIRNERPGLKLNNDVEIPESDAIRFNDFLSEHGITLPSIIDLTQQFHVDFEKTGNTWIHYIEVNVNGKIWVEVNNIDPLNIMYLNTQPGQPRSVVFSKDFFGTGSFTEKPRLIRTYPWFNVAPGFRETIIHVKNKRDHSDKYGRPESLPSIFWQFTEYMHGNLISKIANSELGIKAMLLMQSPDINTIAQGRKQTAGLRVFDLATALRKLSSVRGSHQEMESVATLEYPQGVEKPSLLTFDINRDEKWSRMVLEKASDIIFGKHGWSKILNGWERASSGIGGNVLIDEFKVNNTSTIKPNQRKWERVWKLIFNILISSTQKDEFHHYGVRFEDRIKSLIESLESTKKEESEDELTGNIANGGRGNNPGEDPEGGNAED